MSATCLVNYDVDWGDGFSSNADGGITAKFTHTYNTNPAVGACTPYTIKVKVKNRFTCNDIDGDACPSTKTAQDQKSINMCNPVPGCVEYSQPRKQGLQFNQWGGTYLLEGWIEADMKEAFLDGRKIKVESRLHVWKNNKWKQYRSRHVELRASGLGTYFTNLCTTPNPLNLNASKANKDDISDLVRIRNERFQWNPNPPVHMYSNHYVTFTAADGSKATHQILNNILQ